MKSKNFCPGSIQGMLPVTSTSATGFKRLMLYIILVTLFGFTGCSKNDTDSQGNNITSGKGKASASAQPAPGGKTNFSVAFGEFSETGGNASCFVRLANWTFDPSAGEVDMSMWNWDTNNDIGKTILNSHLCTMDGASKTCNVWAPTGWMVGGSSNPWVAWSGTYTYNTSTGLLHIDWNNGLWEEWTVTNPQTGIARVVFTSSISSYKITHGRGYGSNASWSTYIPVTSMPRVNYNGGGKKVTHYFNYNPSTGDTTNTIDPATPGAWKSDGVDFSAFTSASTGSPTLHRYISGGASCSPGSRQGGVNHLGGNNTSRSIVYNLFQACLTSDTNFPCYVGNLHPLAMQQIINDSGNMVGMIGIEAQNMAGYNNWEFQIRDITTVP